MQIHQLQRPSHLKRSRRVGRGGKRGTFSGRGVKGQKSRAGHRIRPQIWDYILRTPKLRGMTRKSNTSPFGSAQKSKKPVVVVNLHHIEKAFGANQAVTPASLVKHKVVRSHRGKLPLVKILGNGTITKKVSVKGVEVSTTARQKIEQAGGSIK